MKLLHILNWPNLLLLFPETLSSLLCVLTNLVPLFDFCFCFFVFLFFVSNFRPLTVPDIQMTTVFALFARRTVALVLASQTSQHQKSHRWGCLSTAGSAFGSSLACGDCAPFSKRDPIWKAISPGVESAILKMLHEELQMRRRGWSYRTSARFGDRVAVPTSYLLPKNTVPRTSTLGTAGLQRG